MKLRYLFVIVFCVPLIFIACFERPEEEASTGTLEFRMLNWNAPGLQKTLVDTYTCPLIDIRHLIPKIQLTQDTIFDSGPSDQIWFTFYESDEEMLHSERNMSGILDTGTYRGMKIFQRNLIYWVCTHEYDSQDTLQPADRQSYYDALNDTIVNIFGSDGLYYKKNGLLFNVNENPADTAGGQGEHIGCYFRILPGKTTRVTVRMNLFTLDWLDKDEDGVFTPLDTTKDKLDNWTTFADSIITMSDFLVEYLP